MGAASASFPEGTIAVPLGVGRGGVGGLLLCILGMLFDLCFLFFPASRALSDQREASTGAGHSSSILAKGSTPD